MNAGLIVRVLTNLISNAHRYNKPGVQVMLDAVYCPDGPEVRLASRDDGGASPKRSCPPYLASSKRVHKPSMVRMLEKKPDLITLDIQTPRKPGVMFYRQMKSHGSLRDAPVIVVTGGTVNNKDSENLIRSFLEVDPMPSPTAHIEKPYVFPRLSEAVRDGLGVAN